MQSRNLLNLLLIGFILLLLVLVIYKPGKDAPVKPPTLTSLNKDEINRIVIEQLNNKPIELNKSENSWIISSPFKQSFRANQYRIDALMKLAATVSFSQNDLSSLNKEDFGLDQPYATITFNNKTKIIFGHNKSLKKHRYVQINNTLHMITDTFYYQVAARAESFVDHGLLPEEKITAMSLPGLKLEQDGISWRVTPEPESFSQDQANKLISEWQLSQAYDINYAPKKMSQYKPDIKVTTASKTLRFKSFNQKDNFVLLNTDTGLEYILSADRKDALMKLPEPGSDEAPAASANEK